MAKDPAFLFYPGDWLGGTMGMTFEEKGAYLELLLLQFNRGHMTSDMIGQAVGQIWNTIRCKFKLDPDGLWFNERLDLEKNRRKSYSESRKNNIAGVNQYTKKSGHTTEHMNGHMENRDINRDLNKKEKEREPETLIWPTFDDFWNLYDKKTDKDKCQKIWKKIVQADKEAIMMHIPTYKISSPDKTFRKNPYTYLYNKSWGNEIINSLQNGSTHNTRQEPFTAEVQDAIRRKFDEHGQYWRNQQKPKQGQN